MIPKMTLRASVGGLDEKTQQTCGFSEGMRSQEWEGLHRRSDHLICSLADCSTCRDKGSIEGLDEGQDRDGDGGSPSPHLPSLSLEEWQIGNPQG